MVVDRLQTEQLTILEMIFAIATKQNIQQMMQSKAPLYVNITHLSQFLKYLKDTKFRGIMPYSTDKSNQTKVQSPEQDINESKMRDLGILTALAILRIDLFLVSSEDESKPRAWFVEKMFTQQVNTMATIKTLVQSLQPNATNSIVLIAL